MTVPTHLPTPCPSSSLPSSPACRPRDGRDVQTVLVEHLVGLSTEVVRPPSPVDSSSSRTPPPETSPPPPIDCPVSRASFLLAQASLASLLSGGSASFSSFGTSGAVLRVGGGLDGCFSRTSGFVNHLSSAVRDPLPASFSAWEAVHTNLPVLLRKGTVRDAIDWLIPLEQEWETLCEVYLARAAVLLSTLGHAYFFGHRDEQPKQGLPEHILRPWRSVCCRLGRTFVGRVPADDILNNAVAQAEPGTHFALSSAAFGLPEERLSSGLQGAMELRFAPALEAMALAKSLVLSASPSPDADPHAAMALAATLETIASTIVSCASVFQAITPHSIDFDPIIWIKTYPAMGAPILDGELGNSGVDAPLFHAMDAFIDRTRKTRGDLGGMQADRRATLPRNVRVLLEALQSSGEQGVRRFVAQHRDHARLQAAFDGLLQTYVWFLERHRVKAVGVTGVTLGSGRHKTSSGVKSRDGGGAPVVTPDAMLSRLMKAGMASRLGGRPLWQVATAESRRRYEGVSVVVLRVDARLPLEAGDRVQIWPRGSAKRGDGKQADADNARFFSVRDVSASADGGMRLTLTVSCGARGNVSTSLTTCKHGASFRLRPWPSPRFRQPANLSIPLILIGQGSGTGPLLGFLGERVRRKHQAASRHVDVVMGPVLMFIAAKTRAHVPAEMGALEHLSAHLPVTILLALSKQRHVLIRDGRQIALPEKQARPGRVLRPLIAQRSHIEALIKEQGAHMFVCGSADFGAGVTAIFRTRERPGWNMTSAPAQHARALIPSPQQHWHQMHLDLFGSRAVAEINTSAGCSLPPITRSQLAAHNTPESCWTTIAGTVYDLTEFLTWHPGGAKTLLESAGTAADRRFLETHGGPGLQEIKGYLGQFAIGTLVVDAENQPACAVLDKLVRVQNALLNNTAFVAERSPVPFYAYGDALLVFAENGLDELIDLFQRTQQLDIVDDLAVTQDRLRDRFVRMRAECGEMLARASSTDGALRAVEAAVMARYHQWIGAVHALIDAAKAELGRAEGECHGCERLAAAITAMCKGLTAANNY